MANHLIGTVWLIVCLGATAVDTGPVDHHCCTLTMIGTHGLYLDTPQRVRVEGLTVTGFNSAIGLPYGQAGPIDRGTSMKQRRPQKMPNAQRH